MFRDHPLLTVLGRRGRGAIVDALQSSAGPWSVRGLARAADVPATVAARTVQELSALGLLSVLRPGRDARIERMDSPLWAMLQAPLDPRLGACRAFMAAFQQPAGSRTVRWSDPAEHAADPLVPTRIAVIGDDDDATLDAIGPALEAVRQAGWPVPDVTAWTPEMLDDTDPIAQAIADGDPL